MTVRPYILAETTWKTVREMAYDVAVLPWGATEAHNYHLPYGTDNVESDYIAAEAARLAWDAGARVVVLPVVPFGVKTRSEEHTSELQSQSNLVCRLLLEKKKNKTYRKQNHNNKVSQKFIS